MTLLSGAWGLSQDSSTATFLSSYEWTSESKDFGGYSGITVTRDGRDFVLLSDRAHLIEGSIFRHGDQIIGIRSQAMVPLDIPASLFAHKPELDTEGLALDSQGSLYLSLESDNRIIRRGPDGTWDALPEFAPIDALPSNRGIEALAVSQDGAVFAIPEISEGLLTPFPVFRYRETEGWDVVMEISRSLGLLPVGADFGPDGQLYVLERGFDGFGFFSRVRRFAIAEGSVAAGETILVTDRRRHDNLEGIAVWEAESGALRLTLVSDSNFNRFQKTEIVEYGLP